MCDIQFKIWTTQLGRVLFSVFSIIAQMKNTVVDKYYTSTRTRIKRYQKFRSKRKKTYLHAAIQQEIFNTTIVTSKSHPTLSLCKTGRLFSRHFVPIRSLIRVRGRSVIV